MANQDEEEQIGKYLPYLDYDGIAAVTLNNRTSQKVVNILYTNGVKEKVRTREVNI